ncbi:MAG: hypothetical protein ING84_14140 [Cytophagales bacterium]|nr:hypothetical protein [Cytophagales bacterium]MCA6366160.1 hypothetical protein [Cytophagales bacterium]MCA6369830.1 hypothetical protein [Cytophagales bacterium]MCA6374518.1 hypothetical protein [Cytophagales bacterium]MCA6384846.1 hypothetical protein [Cytophagales bacterium]
MKVIALRGEENAGKSHAINIVYSLLLRDGWIQVPGHFRVLGNPKFEDVFDVLEKDGILLGIVGMGDYQRGQASLAKLIAEIISKGCTVVISTCRNTPAIEKAIKNYPDHYFVDKTPSTGPENHRIVNTIDAQRMINLI